MTDKESTTKSKSSSFKKELIQWCVIFLIGAGVYATGYHTEVIGQLQRMLLYTGIFKPETESSVIHGEPADFDMPLISLEGERTSLSEFEGKTIFLNFWATWCPPCIAEMPNIQNLYDDVHLSDIIFVMVSLDADPQKARDFIARKEYSFPVYALAGRKPATYNSSVVPTTYIISPNGTIVMEHQGMANYDTEQFRTFLKNISSQ